MLLNLLSLYIANSLQIDIDPVVMPEPSTSSVVQLASSNIINIVKSASVPIKDPHFITPIINAKSSIAIDRASGQVLFEENPHERRAIASITKLMTLLIVLEENDLNESVIVSQNAATIEGSTMYLRSGEEISVENLIYGAIINSANDAAIALAEHNAGNTDSFVEKMNKKALELGLVNTHFANPAGLDDSDNYSSAYDVSKLGKYIYENEFIQKAAAIKELEVSSVSGDYIHNLTSTNDLLDSYLNIKGLKTGSTDAAGECLVVVAENDGGNDIITVVLNSTDRFTETKILVDWTFRAYSW